MTFVPELAEVGTPGADGKLTYEAVIVAPEP